MALQKRTIKIIVITLVTLLIIGALLGIILGLVLRSDKVELEVWPRDSVKSKEPKISYKVSDNSSYLAWVRQINDTLAEYNKAHMGSNANKLVNCDYQTVLKEDKVCDVNINHFPCTAANNYNYQNGKPCVFLKLSKVVNWMPNPFNTSDLPNSMPDDLKQVIKQQVSSGRPDANQVWVSCEGVSENDKNHIGSLQYIPSPAHGFPAYYFPYTKQEAYLSPLVIVMFENPAQNQVINVVCKAWAKNIVDNSQQTSVRFQLKIAS